ncbi:MAG: hypothetical protein MI922_29555, partial [Bacteroidales bacterium]|nr:hypothetical protein [Bacteroidales bacterium]
MKNKIIKIIYALCIIGTMPIIAFAQSEKVVDVSATISDAEGNPLTNVIVSANGGGVEVISGTDGTFNVQAEEGSMLVLKAKGYETLIVPIEGISSTLT